MATEPEPKRVIERTRIGGTDYHRGFIDGDDSVRTWSGPIVEGVVKDMNHSLGPIPDEQYVIRE